MYKKNPAKPNSGKSIDLHDNFGLGGCILFPCTMANGEMSLCYYILCLNPCLILQASNLKQQNKTWHQNLE
jgi:hypothetical protein